MKNIITNASFRTKKLPEDIPVVDTGCAGEASLGSIAEEKEEPKEKEKEHKETKLGAAKHLLAQSQQILAKAAKEQKNKALKIAGKINPGSSSSTPSASAEKEKQEKSSLGEASAAAPGAGGVSVDGVSIEMSELHLHEK
jgi:hypothetical protein